MPFAVTHVLFAIIAIDLYRDYFTKHKKYFTLHTLFIAGFAGLLPDIDILLSKFLGFFSIEFAHRIITHTPLFALIFLIPGFILWNKEKHKIAMYFFVTCFGILSHIFLDFILASDSGSGILFLYPLSALSWELGLLQSMTTLQMATLFASLDAIILLLWLWHEEVKHKISDFI
jgi:hypothetical protein|tara:strand:- start:25226 stop:25747 length:522 start_codon:yes stop_codon:yes gene_type:complete